MIDTFDTKNEGLNAAQRKAPARPKMALAGALFVMSARKMLLLWRFWRAQERKCV